MSPRIKDKYLLHCCVIHQQRCFIEQKLNNLGLKSNHEHQYCLILERNHIEYYEYLVDDNNKIYKKYHHYLRNQIDKSHFEFTNLDIHTQNDKDGIHIFID